MYLVIYRKSDSKPLLQEGISSFFTQETYDANENYNHVVRVYGGEKKDYDEVWIEDSEIIKKTLTYEYTIVNGEIVFGEEKVSEGPAREQTSDDYLLNLDFRLSSIELGL